MNMKSLRKTTINSNLPCQIIMLKMSNITYLKTHKESNIRGT